MSWRDRLQNASWRGVTFFVESHGATGGHRLHKHQFAQRAGQYAEEIGQQAEGYKVDAFVLGADYDKQRDRLLKELRRGGMGELVHPYLGALRCKCEAWTVSESGEQGGVAKFSLTFVQSDEQIYPTIGVAPGSSVEEAAGKLKTSVFDRFLKVFKVAGTPGYVAAAAADRLTDVAAAIEDATPFYFGESEAVANLSVALSTLKNNAVALVTGPASAATAMQNALGLLTAAASTDRAFFALFGFGDDLDPVPTTTPARRQEGVNQAVIRDLVQSTAIAEAASQATSIDFVSYTEAVEHRGLLQAAIDVRMEATEDDTEYQALQALRVGLTLAVPIDDDLPRLKAFTPVTTAPVLLISQQLYGNVGMAADIVARNGIRHPGFVAGGTAIQVLTNE